MKRNLPCSKGGFSDVDECWRVKGKAPIPVRWVDVDKGFGVVHSRLVAKDFKPRSSVGDREDLFAATTPLEAKKIVFSLAATEGIGFKGMNKAKGMQLIGCENILVLKRYLLFSI